MTISRKIRLALEEKMIRQARDGDFLAYCFFMDGAFFLKRPVLSSIINVFQKVYNAFLKGETYNVACSLPPRAGKSYLTTLFVTFMLGHFPKNSVMRNTCTDPLYEKFSYDTREIIRTQKYLTIFPDSKLNIARTKLSGWYLRKACNPSYFGAGTNGTVIGFGSNMLAITDDLFRGFEDAMSETKNEKVWTWAWGTHNSRVEGNCCCIDIGTRWSKNDVLGRREEMGFYDEIVRIPALDKNGNTFCEAVKSTEFYNNLKETLDPIIFNAEYMQEPIEVAGLLFPRDELRYFELKDIEGRTPIASIASCDVADEGDDYFSSPFADFFGGETFYIKDVLFTNEAVEITGPSLVGKLRINKTQKILIESNAGGRIFSINTSDNSLDLPVEIETRPTTSHKRTKLIMWAGFIKKHFAFRSDYEPGSEYARFMDQLCSYLKTGKSKHDDAPDSLTILAEYIVILELLINQLDGQPISKSSLGIR